MDILKMVTDVAGKALTNQASGFLGESQSNTQSAITAILPSLLGGLIGKSQQSGGAGAIMDLLNNNNMDGGMLDNLSGMFSGGESTNALTGLGGSLLTAVLGDKVGGLVDMVSGFAGLKKSSSNSLLSMAMPLIMSMIGKQIKSKGMGLSGLTSLLSSQAPHVASAIPKGMGNVADLLGFSSAMSGGGSIPTPKAPKVETPSGGGGWMKWLLPLLAIAAGLYFWKGCDTGALDAAKAAKEKTEQAAADAAQAAKDAAAATADAAKNAADAAGEGLSDAVKAAREGLANLTFTAGSAGEKMMNYLNSGDTDADGTFRFINLNFASGSAEITDANAGEVDNLASVMAAYPNVNVEIQGYTDSQGNDDNNKALSQRRADAVKARLLVKGIGASRVNAVGYGEASPVATNDTAEGRAQNRRIEVKITGK
jgi:outer membrane protein OmpA-like peptidoglycan-associated protein